MPGSFFMENTNPDIYHVPDIYHLAEKNIPPAPEKRAGKFLSGKFLLRFAFFLYWIYIILHPRNWNVNYGDVIFVSHSAFRVDKTSKVFNL